jgi:type IV secretory pathway VirB3-like protein
MKKCNFFIFILATTFFIYTPTDFLFYHLFYLNTIFQKFLYIYFNSFSFFLFYLLLLLLFLYIYIFSSPHFFLLVLSLLSPSYRAPFFFFFSSFLFFSLTHDFFFFGGKFSSSQTHSPTQAHFLTLKIFICK